MKKLWTALLCTALLVCTLLVTASAEGLTVFVKDGGKGNGESPECALSEIADAFAILGDAGGTVVLCGKTTMDSALTALPAWTDTVTLTMVYDGTDYRESGAELYYTGQHRFFFAGPTKIENFTFHIGKTALIAAQWHSLEMGEGITVKQHTEGEGIYLLGGTQNAAEGNYAFRDKGGKLVIRSGSYHVVSPYGRQIKGTFTGSSTVDIYGGEIRYYMGGPVNLGILTADSTVNVYGGEIANLCLFTDQTNTTAALQGEGRYTAKIHGGKIRTIVADANNQSATFTVGYTSGAQSDLADILSGEARARLTVDDLATTEVKLTIGSRTGYVDGVAKPLDAAPVIRFDRTMLPVRFVAENLGAAVGWDGVTGTVTLRTADTAIEIVIGSATAKVNGTAVALDSPAFIENSRTYLPVRFVAENLGAAVAWDGATSTATLTAAAVAAPAPEDSAPTEERPAEDTVAAPLAPPDPAYPASEYNIIAKADYLDKTTAGFVAQLVGMLSGYEYVKADGRDRVAMPDEWFELCNGPYAGNDKYAFQHDKLLQNGDLWEVWIDDDFSVDIFNQYSLERMYATYGTVSAKLVSDGWTDYGIWDMGGGQRQAGAYGLISRRGYLPQFAGNGEFGNWYSFLSEPYIATDTLGLSAAGMPETAATLAGTFAVVTGDRDNVEWAKMFAAMYSMAYFESDIETLIRSAAKVFPDGSFMRALVDELFALHAKYPNDWRTAYTELENKYYVAGETKSANTTINCAFALLDLLYGGGDFTETARIGSLAGYDCETTAGIALSVLSIINGMEVMPEVVNELVWQDGRGVIVNRSRAAAPEDVYMHADNLPERMPIADIVLKFVKNFESVLLENGGHIDDGYYYIPAQTIEEYDAVLIGNGGFESGTLDGFTVRGSAEVSPFATVGLHAAKLAGDTELSTTVRGLTVGKQYALIAYIYATDKSAAYLYARSGGATVGAALYRTVGSAVYDSQKTVKRTLLFTATAPEMEIGVRFVPNPVYTGEYAIVDEFTIVRHDETSAGSVEIANKTADGVYNGALHLTVNAQTGREVLLRIDFANPAPMIVDAKILLDGEPYSTAAFSATGTPPAGLTAADCVLLPIVFPKGEHTVSLTFPEKLLTVRAVSLVTADERR